jgi:hypothetical protein
MWFDEPRIQLTFEKVMERLKQVEPEHATGKRNFFVYFYYFYRGLDERVLAGKIFLYLERYGYINFGVFKRLTSPLGSKFSKQKFF